ncbi:MAG: hypothetical protein GT589_00675 [Peptoclostridium sp.]|uniref:hypothetical protein n=1 Tax=Peptoclostridium sp. TaxID=1904860 RepID=UPI00139BF3C3|nr:hypothetical protein [Peptoclostridium sp.]MZQ74658.1 hypothetical protein [Peptoclostridium sp.]
MTTTEIQAVLDELHSILSSNTVIDKKKKDKLILEIEQLKKGFKDIPEIHENLTDVYTSLVKKGRELKALYKNKVTSNDKKELESKAIYYIRYLKAAKGDFLGETPYVIKYIRFFFVTALLFIALSPMYFGFILPGLMFVPIFLGFRGVKQRTKPGFHFSLAVVPVGIMTAALWVRYGMYAMMNFEKEVAAAMQNSGQGQFVGQLLVAGPPILGALLMICACMQAYFGYKSKDLFV